MMNNRYAEEIYDIAVETFELMCYMFPLDESEILSDRPVLPEQRITSIVRFDGAAEGGMVIRATPELTDALAMNMLGTEKVSREQKEGALCEMVNIICGNVAPFFNKGEKICYIRPPWIAGRHEQADDYFKGMNREAVTLHLDDGSAEILVYYS